MLDFEKRKRDHIDISLSDQSQAEISAGFETVELVHEALPNLNFDEIQTKTKSLNLELSSPFFVSSMTLGHDGAQKLNSVFASVCESRNILMAVGSQRRQLTDKDAVKECQQLRTDFPKLKVLGNIGLSQLISMSEAQVVDLVAALGAQGIVVHTNPLQECLQPEGTPQFKSGVDALTRVCALLKVPVVLKETGSGFSQKTLEKIKSIGLAAVDVSGRGGTHWGRVETQRASRGSVQAQAGASFKDWGVSTVASTHSAVALQPPFEVWSSGGVRTGLDGAKLLAMGAQMVDFARPVLQAAIKGEESLQHFFDVLDYELKVAMFCTGVANVDQLRAEGVWKWI